MLTWDSKDELAITICTFNESLNILENVEGGDAGTDVGETESISGPTEYEIEDFITINKENTYNLLNDILNKINNNRIYNDKFTQKKINEDIERKSDIEKEGNLKFIEELDKEGRQAIKTMILLGLDTWKGLSKKQNKLYY